MTRKNTMENIVWSIPFVGKVGLLAYLVWLAFTRTITLIWYILLRRAGQKTFSVYVFFFHLIITPIWISFPCLMASISASLKAKNNRKKVLYFYLVALSIDGPQKAQELYGKIPFIISPKMEKTLYKIK